MKRHFALVVASVGLALLSAGCGQRSEPSRVASGSSAQPSWDAAANPFVVPGWKSGDRTSWQDHLAQRAQNQNDYLRMR